MDKKLKCLIGIIVVVIILMIVAVATSDGNSNNGNNEGTQIKVIYDGSWSGALSTGDGSSKTIEGTGNETINVTNNTMDMVSANAQKMDGGSGELKIQLLKNGEVKKESSTTAQYGIADVTA